MYSLDELVARLGGEVVGDGRVNVRRVATLDQAQEGDLSFLSNPKYAARLKSCRASAIIVGSAGHDLPGGRPLIVAGDPYLYFAKVARLFNPPLPVVAGVHPRAVVEAVVPPTAEVAAGATIEAGAEIGEGVVIGAGSYIGAGVRVGAGTRVAPRVTVYPGCVIGRDCVIHAGAVIGSDGFGFAREADGSWLKIPQTGRVVIGDDVEIGANTTIDRGALDDTVIGNGAKLDNQIQVGHNVRIGDFTAIAGCVGIAGSTEIGARCRIGGQAGIIGHLRIADDVVISAGTLVTKSILRPGVYTANLPVQGHAEWVRNFAHLRHLDAMADRIRALEQRLAERDSN